MARNFSRRDLLKAIGVSATASSATLAGCSASGNTPTVTMQGFGFQPRRLEVAPGTTVEWMNYSDAPHTVTAYGDRIPEDSGYFASGGYESERAARDDVGGGLLDAGESFTHRFEVTGSYRYFCIPHEHSDMVGEVIVD